MHVRTTEVSVLNRLDQFRAPTIDAPAGARTGWDHDTQFHGGTMKGIVIGGGIAGLTTAMGLRSAGIEVEVFERRAEPPEGEGLFLTLAVNGLRALKQLGALESVLSQNVVNTPELVFESSSGKVLGRTSNGVLDGVIPSITIKRGDLLSALEREAARRGIRVDYGHVCSSIRSDGRSATVEFAHGSSATANFVVGADGIRSTVREQIAPSAPPPSFTGLVNLGGVCRIRGLPPTTGEMRMLWGQRAFLGYTIDPNGDAWWFANVAGQEGTSQEVPKDVSTGEWRTQLLTLFEGDPKFSRDLISATERIHAYPILDLSDQPSSWSSGRVVLVGDAAHAVAPSTGQGASLAIEDALCLALMLRRESSIGAAFTAFETERRPRAERMMVEGRRRGAYKAPANEFARRIRDLVLPLALRLFASERRMSWIHDYEVPWSAGDPQLSIAQGRERS